MLLLALPFAAAALACLLAILTKAPSFRFTARLMKREKAKAENPLQTFMERGSRALAPHIRIGEIRKEEMQKQLDAGGSPVTPEQYLAGTWIQTAGCLLLEVPCLLIRPLLGIVPPVLAVLLWSKRKRGLTEMGNLRRLEIERELPRFIPYITHMLQSSRNVIAILDSYRVNYESSLANELAYTVADMRTGNPELALQRFGQRINSPYVHSLVRGILSSMRGDDMSLYFENLSFELTHAWQERLTAQARKKGDKISTNAYLLFGAAILTVLVVIGSLLGSAMAGLQMG